MARKYAPIITAIWRDADFRKLSRAAQGMYLLLVSQPNISGVGTLPLTVGRWAAMATDTSGTSVRADLDELSQARFVVVDPGTEELLVRSFVRWDGGYRNSKRRPVIEAAAVEVDSPVIRRVLAVEFERLGLPPEWVSDRASDGPPDRPPRHRPTFRDSPGMWEGDKADIDSGPRQTPGIVTHEYPQEDRVSGTQSDAPTDGITRFDRVVDTNGEWRQPATHNPQPPLPSRRDAAHTTSAARQPAEEGEEEADHERTTRKDQLVTAIRKIRPDWSTNSIRRALNHEDVRERPWPTITAAITAIAHDPTTTAPGRLRHDGPWWNTPPPTQLTPPCGQCDTNRMITVPGGLTRCPACHPLRRTA